VPTKLTVTGPVTGALLAAVSVTTNGVFGITEIVVGDAVTPVGKPFTATAIVPLKPPIAVLLSVTCPFVPCVRGRVLGEAVRVKSAVVMGVVATTVSATEVLELSVPEVPTKFTVTGPATGALLAAVSVTTTGVFGVTEIVVGDAVTPVGKPFTATAIVPLKPSIAVPLRVTCPLVPCVRARVLGAAASVKFPVEMGVVATTVSATGVLVLSIPDEPNTFTVVVPSAASAAAVNVKVVLEPTVSVAVAGDTVTPVGSPLTETCTDPAKLSALVGVTVIVLVCP
jgi:hypothetical protein